jgi:excisionase family DNA binding protein
MDPQASQPKHSTSTPPATSLLTRQDAALALSTCLRTVDEAIASGDIEIVRIGRSVRIRPSALELFIEARTTRRNPRRSGKPAKSTNTANTGGVQ